MKRILALALVALFLCGCSVILPTNGTLSVDGDSISRIEITNGQTDGNTFTVQDREAITTIVKYLNSYTLEGGAEPVNGWLYKLSFVDSKGEVLLNFTIVSEAYVALDQLTYGINAKDLLNYTQKLECDTMTDQQLIDMLLKGNTLDQLNILDADGKVSLDMIMGLPDSCPGLFELLSRPSAIASVSSYGVDQLGAFLNSSNPELVEKAQEWIEVLKNLLPDVQEKLEDLIKNQENNENNP